MSGRPAVLQGDDSLRRNEPDWLADLLGAPLPSEGEAIDIDGHRIAMRQGLLRATAGHSPAQGQTAQTFGYKWARRETYDRSPAYAEQTLAWLEDRYGRAKDMAWLVAAAEPPILLDAGCGSAFSSLLLFGNHLRQIRYLGADISNAVDTARQRFAEQGIPGRFLQCDLMSLPLRPGSIDAIYSEGVLHHTDDTRTAILALSRLLKPGGRFLFYVYRRKGPIREFADDYVREKLQSMTPDEAWNALMPLTRLGKALGDLNTDVDVPEPVDLLEIPAGRINLQRLVYWHVFKAFYRPDMTLDEMNHINFDWYAPKNAHRQSPEEVRAWCAEAGLDIERERVEESGITVVARRMSASL
jgi:arsenite methyltransferase